MLSLKYQPRTGFYLKVLYFSQWINNIYFRRELKSDTFHFDAQRMIGHGSFGAVFLAKVVETDEMVAIKKVLQDKRFKNRELQIMRQLVAQPHPFIVALKQHFVTKGSKNDDQYLNLVLEYIPETIYSVAKYFIKRKETMPIFSIKIYMYQLARALAHIHGIGICHRWDLHIKIKILFFITLFSNFLQRY